MLAPFVRATVAATLVVGVAMTAFAAAPRTPRSDRTGAIGAAASTAGGAGAAAAAAGDAASADAQPTSSAAAGQDGGDLRSSGEGAGLAGSPLLAIGAVLAIGAGSAAATLVYVRLTAGRGDHA